MESINCFKSYDVRGKLGQDLNESIAYKIGNGFARYLDARRIVIGGDVRLSTEALKSALAKGITDFGADVVDIGLSGSEELYYAAFSLDVDGGIEVTGSHNPVDYNGMKFVGRGALPIGQETGLLDIKSLAETEPKINNLSKGENTYLSIVDNYIHHLLTYFNKDSIKPLKIVVNSGNGAAGHIVDGLEKEFMAKNIPITFIKIQHQADGTFPNGVPNPLLPSCRKVTSDAVLENKADLGIAWDGDFDRCFLFDETGGFIEGYYTVGLLAEAFLKKSPGEKIVYDPRMVWNTIDLVKANSGIPIECQSGHTFMKECMRNTQPWKQWPARMLRHKAMIQAARIAFSFSGIEDQDEFDRGDHVEKVVVVDSEVKGAESVKQKLLNKGDQDVPKEKNIKKAS